MNKLVGKKVSFDKKLVRETSVRKYGHYRKMWIISECNPSTGIICAKRRKTNGQWHHSDNDSYWHTSQVFDCYLVAVSLNQQVLVPVESVTFLNEPEPNTRAVLGMIEKATLLMAYDLESLKEHPLTDVVNRISIIRLDVLRLSEDAKKAKNKL